MDSRETPPSPPSQCLQIAKYESQNENFVFSPWSIDLALSLLANGSKGSTKQELLTFLQAESLEDLNLRNKQLLDSWTKPDKETATFMNRYNQSLLGSLSTNPKECAFMDDKLMDSLSRPYEAIPVLSFAGGIWVDQSLTLNPTFKTMAEDTYKGRAETVDFQDKIKHREIVDGLNRWVEEATNGLIKSLLSEDSVNQSTRLVLANALYLRQRWSTPFNKSLTREHKFYLLDGSSVDVPFMSSTRDRDICISEDFKVLRLPYDMSSNSMYIVLPNSGVAVLPLLEKIVSDPTFVDRYIPKQVKVGTFLIPKFTISYKFEVSRILRDVGLQSCFSYEAEFGEMVLDLKDRDLLKNSQVLHKSYFRIDEEGTEAAAATIANCYSCDGGPVTAPVDFVADHPFIFLVRDNKSKTVLFLGHVQNPLLK